jgi:fructose-1,6-bisphosphatase/inositol monophosphatase family enzyme
LYLVCSLSDGTQNFTHGAPLSVVSIGFCENGVPVLGVIYDPYRDEIFTAVKGEGAFLNGRPIACDTSVATLQRALLTIEVGYERSTEGISAMVGGIDRLLTRNIQSLRILGSTVLCLAWVACGRANAFAVGVHNEGGKPWDYCAGFVVAEEAGVVFRRLDGRSYGSHVDAGETFDIYSKSCVCAGTAALADEIVRVLKRE